MIFIILSSRLGIHSSVSPSLLLVPSSAIFISVIVFLSFDWFFSIFSSSLLKFSLCSYILFPNSVSVLITNALNFLSGKLFIFISLCIFFQVFFLALSIETNFCLLILLNFLCLYEIR